jgi:geranylgeranyl diphosphate synthase type II
MTPSVPSASSAPGAEEILAAHSQTLSSYLQQKFASPAAAPGAASASATAPAAPPRLIEAIAYSVMAGGKRLRPTLIMESAIACGGTEASRQAALVASAAMELIHTFSLVHDDLPAMDNDDLRRGRPTSHKVFGEAMAILAGDAMVTMAFELLAEDLPPALAAPMVRELAHSAGPAGMIGGQVLDMEGENHHLNLDQLQQLHQMKTGALLIASCRLGALAAGASAAQLESLTAFGRYVGLAFQIVDDILDQTSTPEQMGKATKKDVAKGKNTYPSLLGLEARRVEAAAQLDLALSALAPLGANANGLRAVARFVVERNH